MVNPIVAMIRRPRQRRHHRRLLRIAGEHTVHEEGFRRIGGIEQWVTVRGHDRDNPVVVIVHGGPGSPYTPFNSWITGWEQGLTVVQWDQRGGGKTFVRAGNTAPGLSLERLADDGIELVEHLVGQLGQRVLLVGSSVGSLTASIMVRRRPDLFRALVAANVLAPDPDDERYRQLLRWAQDAGKTRAVRALERVGADHRRWSPEDSLAFSKLAIAASDDVPHMVYDLMLPALMYDPTLTMRDIRSFDTAMSVSLHALQPEYEDYDYASLGFDYGVPVTFVQGAEDRISPPGLARQYLDAIRAPRKQLVTVAGAGHLVEFADPARFLSVLRTSIE